MKGIKGFQKGHPNFVTDEGRKRIGIAASIRQKGKKPGCYKHWEGKKRPNITEEGHFRWKGDKVGITALHDWVKSRLGKPNRCEHCGTTKAKKFEWANKSHEYKRELNDWIRLCTKCHRIYDGHAVKMWETRRLKTK
jgi:hypothetical protein